MKALRLCMLAGLLATWTLASLGAEPLKREPLRPFSEVEHLVFRGALVVAGVVAAWFLLVVFRGMLRERRETRARQDPPGPPANQRS